MLEKEPGLHGNAGRHGAMSIVLEVLKAHPAGMTSTQIADYAIQNKLTEGDANDGSRATYHRIKRACDGLEKLGYIESVKQIRDGVVWVANLDRIEEDTVREAKKAFEEFQARMQKRIPLSDGARLLAAFEGVIREEFVKLTPPPRPKVSTLAMEIKKKPV